MTLRDARADDIGAIQAIYADHVLHSLASFEEIPPDAGEMARRMDRIRALGLPCLVAVLHDAHGDRIGGFAYASPFRDRSAYRYTVEDSVYIASDALRRGLGRALLGAVIEKCAERGYRQMIAVIGDSANDASIGLHADLGFEVIGVMPAVGYKHGRWVDTVRMQRALGPGAAAPPDDAAGARPRTSS